LAAEPRALISKGLPRRRHPGITRRYFFPARSLNPQAKVKGMTPQAVFHHYFPILYLSLAGLLGWAGGWLATVILGIWLAPSVQWTEANASFQDAATQKRALGEYQVILDRNIFNSAAAAAAFSGSSTEPAAVPAGEQSPARQQAPLNLIGTVVAGPDSLAVIRDGREIRVFRLGEEVGGRTVDEIFRNMVVLRQRDGSLENLTLPTELAQPGHAPARAARGKAAAAAPAPSRFNIQQVGENKWQIPREAADHARGNLNELLTQAHMEPRIVDGETSGFVVRMIRPGSFFDMLGLRRGDVLLEVNDIGLNSPERALQIFQQLREARDIKVALLRNDEAMTFEYETN
jgi:general secretion pathway protein C